jgi:hypothetical protein
MYMMMLYGKRHNYGKATIFNGVFESSNPGKFEQIFA